MPDPDEPMASEPMSRTELVLPTRGPVAARAVFRWLGFANNLLLLPMFTVMVLETSTGDAKAGFSYAQANLFFCSMFLIEYFAGLALARCRGSYLRDPTKLTDLVSSVPFGYVFQGLRVVRLLRILRLTRVMWRARRFRGKGAKLVRAAGMVGSLTFAGAMAFRIVEPESTSSLFDAVWWSIVTLSTVGYGDVMPVTSAGRIVAMALILAGIGVFGFMAGFVTSMMEDPEEDEILATVKRIEERLEQLDPTSEHTGGMTPATSPLRCRPSAPSSAPS